MVQKEFPAAEISHFVDLARSYYQGHAVDGVLNSNIFHTPEKQAIQAELLQVVAAAGSSVDQQSFLRQALRHHIVTVSQEAVSILKKPQAQKLYRLTNPPITIGEMISEDYEYGFITDVVQPIRESFIGLATENFSSLKYKSSWHFPYDQLSVRDNLDMARLTDNLGHDLNYLPGTGGSIQYLPSRTRRAGLVLANRLNFDLLPKFHQGAVWMFESFKYMAAGHFPRHATTDLSAVLEVISCEAAHRSMGQNSEIFLLEAPEYRYQNLDKIILPNLIGNNRSINTWFHISADVEPNLTLTGNQAGLHLLFYQFVKNSIRLMVEPRFGIKDAYLDLTAKKCVVDQQPLIAVRMTDNGPGLDLAAILRAKQRLLLASDGPLSNPDQQMADSWSSLDLKVLDIVNLMFERRVSGVGRTSPTSPGLGLAMAKEIIDLHGGCIWATNIAGENGAKFLLIFDPSEKGSLRKNLPQLFQARYSPAGILNMIEQQLDQGKQASVA